LKNQTQRRAHARQRAQERYNVALSKQLRRDMLTMIRSGQSVRKLKLTHTRTAHLLLIGGKRIAVIYSNSVKDIVTVLPEGTWQFSPDRIVEE
jgi:hypothetical protein